MISLHLLSNSFSDLFTVELYLSKRMTSRIISLNLSIDQFIGLSFCIMLCINFIFMSVIAAVSGTLKTSMKHSTLLFFELNCVTNSL